jgi:sarcosine oxidase subunit gamma
MAPRSPLHGVELPDGLRELPFRAQVNLRAALPGLPGPGRSARDGDRTTLWLGPDEWLVTGPPGAQADIEHDLRAAIAAAGGWGAVTDVSAQRTTLELGAPGAREVLAKGCSLDLHPRSFGPGRCAGTDVARANVVLHQVDDRPTYELLVAGSLAAYLAAWLADAMEEHD